MSTKDRILVYAIGVIMGLLLLGIFQRLRDDGSGEPKRFLHGVFQNWVEESGLRNLPEGSPAYLRNSRLQSYLATRPDGAGNFEYIWILSVEEGHPRVRVVESLVLDMEAEAVHSTGFAVMAADQVLAALNPGANLEDLDRFLSEHGMERREYLKGSEHWLIQLDQWDVLTVPKAVARLEQRDDLIRASGIHELTWR